VSGKTGKEKTMKNICTQNKPWVRIWTTRLLMIAFIAVCLIPLTLNEAIGRSNNKPIAVIDGDINIKLGQRIYLNGNLSSDPNGDRLRYRWTLVSVPGDSQHPVGKEKTKAAFSAKPDVAGEYKVKLVVNDGYEDSEPAYATIYVIEQH
jgi:hypothetical protein